MRFRAGASLLSAAIEEKGQNAQLRRPVLSPVRSADGVFSGGGTPRPRSDFRLLSTAVSLCVGDVDFDCKSTEVFRPSCDKS
jgi:hypothetical protein